MRWKVNDSDFDLKIKEMFPINWRKLQLIKVTATDMIYFARSKVSKSLVQKKYFGLMSQVIFKSEYLFYQGR